MNKMGEKYADEESIILASGTEGGRLVVLEKSFRMLRRIPKPYQKGDKEW